MTEKITIDRFEELDSRTIVMFGNTLGTNLTRLHERLQEAKDKEHDVTFAYWGPDGPPKKEKRILGIVAEWKEIKDPSITAHRQQKSSRRVVTKLLLTVKDAHD